MICVLVVLQLLLAAMPGGQTTQAFHRGATPNEALNDVHRGRLLVAVVGIDAYGFWPQLHTAVSDAVGLERVLQDKFGFSEAAPPLLNEKASRAALMKLVEDDLRKALKPDDELVLFFAGHGTTRVDQLGDNKVETGFIVPVDAHAGSEEEWSEYIQIDNFLADAAKLPSRHVLVILDACHSGFALGRAVKSFRSDARYEKDLISRVSRRVITSARNNQLALDNGPIPGHSLFTGTLIDGLNWGSADLDGNGLITSSEIGLFLQNTVGRSSESSQTPDFGSFEFDDRGELVLPLRDSSFDGVKARALSAIHRGELGTFRDLQQQAAKLRPQAPETLYITYRRALLDGRFDDAIDAVEKLISLNPPGGVIPLSRKDLYDLRNELPYWKPILTLPETPLPVELKLQVGKTKGDVKTIDAENLGDTIAYSMTPGSFFRWTVHNPLDKPAFLYILWVDQNGRLALSTPSREWVDGLMPGHTENTDSYKQDGAIGIEEAHFIYTPKMNPYLLSPSSIMTRGVETLEIDAATLSTYRHHVERLAFLNAPHP